MRRAYASDGPLLARWGGNSASTPGPPATGWVLMDFSISSSTHRVIVLEYLLPLD